MALKTPYLAAENSAMERRSRALHRFLAGSPIALLIAVGLVGHIRKPPYAHPAGSAEYDRQVLAYQPRVAATHAFRRGDDEPSLLEVAEAKVWIEGYASGALKPIGPAVYEDHLRDGVRGEIVRNGLNLASDVALAADRTLAKGKSAEGAQEALLASETAFGLRNFEIQAYLQSLLLVRRGLGLVAQAWPSLPNATKDALRPRIQALRVDSSEVDQLAKIENDQFTDYLRRQKIASPRDADPRLDGGASDQEVAAAKRSVNMSNARVAFFFGGSEGKK